ncbi:MAG: hypothetical protein A2Y24_01810 [Clostridiales bacterium GWE2_32_10]|nr:MAG: hypothetical protein A2Y24_01810 [Clostridiales bacterium GWE2_32_10]
MNKFNVILGNEILTVSVLAWFLAQTLKVIGVLIKYRKLDFRRFVGSGGMPSSHSAFVCAMSFGVGENMGYESPLFGVCVVMSLIVMYDAAGVRRAAGKQAVVLNKLVNEIDTNLVEERLKELLGHTPVEVLVGGILGIILAIFYI